MIGLISLLCCTTYNKYVVLYIKFINFQFNIYKLFLYLLNTSFLIAIDYLALLFLPLFPIVKDVNAIILCISF